MKKRTHDFAAAFLLLVFAFQPAARAAETLKEARVNQIVKDVKVIEPDRVPRQAKLQDPVRGQTAVKTGIQSRSELVFHDSTVTRLGANTLFSFTQGTRNMTLKEGTLLLQTPPNAGGAKISTA